MLTAADSVLTRELNQRPAIPPHTWRKPPTAQPSPCESRATNADRLSYLNGECQDWDSPGAEKSDGQSANLRFRVLKALRHLPSTEELHHPRSPRTARERCDLLQREMTRTGPLGMSPIRSLAGGKRTRRRHR